MHTIYHDGGEWRQDVDGGPVFKHEVWLWAYPPQGPRSKGGPICKHGRAKRDKDCEKCEAAT